MSLWKWSVRLDFSFLKFEKLKFPKVIGMINAVACIFSKTFLTELKKSNLLGIFHYFFCLNFIMLASRASVLRPFCIKAFISPLSTMLKIAKNIIELCTSITKCNFLEANFIRLSNRGREYIVHWNFSSIPSQHGLWTFEMIKP